MNDIKLEQMIYYFKDNSIHSAPVLSIIVVSNSMESLACTDVQKKLFTPFGKAGIYYGTCHGIVDGKLCFDSKEALLNSL